MPHYIFEARALKTVEGPIAGVDEAGRGPLAGPVVAAAVILDRKRIPKGLNDSKQLTEEAREELFPRILDMAIAVGVLLVCAYVVISGALGAVVSMFATPILGGIAGPVTRFVLDKLKAS